jgi:hypothetical protein
MAHKKLEKLVLKKEIIASLSKLDQNLIKGGDTLFGLCDFVSDMTAQATACVGNASCYGDSCIWGDCYDDSDYAYSAYGMGPCEYTLDYYWGCLGEDNSYSY